MQPRRSLITIRKLLLWGLLLLLLVAAPRIITSIKADPYTTSVDSAPRTDTAIVLAAEILPNGTPAAVLRDRIKRGVDLYFAGKVNSLVMSGKAPEPAIMREYAVSLGVPEADIRLDDGGVRTYATCYNAVSQLELDEAIVVTQPYHLPRTIFLCREMGLEATGVAAHHGRYWRGSWLIWNIRETLATVLAFKEIYLQAPDTAEYTKLYQQGVENND